MKRTGVFYHETCSENAYDMLLMSVKEGFQALEKGNFLSQPNIPLFESEPASEELILSVHTKDMLESVRRSGYYEASLYSVGGMVQATEKVLTNEIDNAFVFVGVGGHHASRTSYWGGCFLNPMAIAITKVRESLGVKRFAIVDTDTHHADGTRAIFKDDGNILHICFCGGYFWNFRNTTQSKTKVCLSHVNSDEEFIQKLKEEIPPRIKEFKPELLYWVCGLDTHKDSYVTRIITERCYPKLAQIIKETADEFSNGKLVVETYSNAPAHVTKYVNPRIVDCLAELGKFQ